MKNKIEDIKNIVDDIRLDFGARCGYRVLEKGDGFLIQFYMYMSDRDTGEYGEQRGGKHYISPYAIESEVVFKALKAARLIL